jgi:hypothetical protein
MFDLRQKYENSYQSDITQGPSEEEEVLPQVCNPNFSFFSERMAIFSFNSFISGVWRR